MIKLGIIKEGITPQDPETDDLEAHLVKTAADKVEEQINEFNAKTDNKREE